MSYHWPGNVRELQNVLERAMILLRGDVIGPDLLSFPRAALGDAAAAASKDAPREPRLDPPDRERPPRFDEAERRAIVQALESAGWRIGGRHGAAELLGLKPTTLHAKMKRLASGDRPPARCRHNAGFTM